MDLSNQISTALTEHSSRKVNAMADARPLYLLAPNKILIMLNGGGPRPSSELAVMLNMAQQSVVKENSWNHSLGFIEPSEPSRPKSGEIIWKITDHGKEHIEKALQTTYKPMKSIAPMRDKIVAELPNGIYARDSQKLFGIARGNLTNQIKLLRQLGYNIVTLHPRSPDARYVLIKAPS